MLVEGGSVTALRCIRSICVFPHSSTQESLRGRPLRSAPLSTRVGDTYTGGPTFCPHSGQGGGATGALRGAAFIPEDDCIPAFSQAPSRRKDRTDLRSQHKGELAFHWQDTFSCRTSGWGVGGEAKNAETTVFAPRCYGSIIIGQRCRNVVKYLEIILLLLFHHPTPTPAEEQSLIGITKHIKVFNIIPTSLWLCVYICICIIKSNIGCVGRTACK